MTTDMLYQPDKLFVYGIFLDEYCRDAYGMSNPRYTTVKGYSTVGGSIVSAVKDEKYTLTGLEVDINPRAWKALDRLEGGYDRVKVKTTDGIEVYMYVGKEQI